MAFGDKTILTEAEVEHLILRLATDDAFRAEVEADPHTVLDEYNVNVDPTSGVVPECVTLPTKAELLKNLEWYLEQMKAARIGAWPFRNFDTAN